MSDASGGAGYAPVPGGLGVTPTITGEPAPELPPATAPQPPPAVLQDPNAPPPPNAVAGPAAPPGAPLGLMNPPPPAATAAAPLAAGNGVSAPLGGMPSGIPAGALDTGLPEAGNLARSIQRNNADLNRRQAQAEHAEVVAADAAGKVEVAKAQATADASAIEYQAQVRRDSEIAARQKYINDDQTRQRGQLDTILQNVNSTPFDPNRYVDNLNIGQRLMTAISVGLGAFGGAGGHNIGLDMLNRAIDGDVAAQKAQYDRGLNFYNAKKSAYQMAREAGMDEANAMRTASIDAHQTAEQGIKVAGQRFAPAEAQANRQVLLAHVQGEQAKRRQELYSAFASNSIASFNTVANRSDQQFNRALQLGNLAINQENADGKLAMAEAKANAKPAMSIPHWQGVAATPDAYNKATEAVGTEHILTRKLTEMANYADDSFHGKQLSATERNKVASTAAQVKVALKDKFKLGVMSQSDEALLDSVAKNPNQVTLFTDAEAAQLRHLIQQMQSDTDDQLEAYGFTRDNDPKYKVDFEKSEGAK